MTVKCNLYVWDMLLEVNIWFPILLLVLRCFIGTFIILCHHFYVIQTTSRKIPHIVFVIESLEMCFDSISPGMSNTKDGDHSYVS